MILGRFNLTHTPKAAYFFMSEGGVSVQKPRGEERSRFFEGGGLFEKGSKKQEEGSRNWRE